MNKKNKNSLIFLSILSLLVLNNPVYAAKLWSTSESFLGTGNFYGPGAYTSDQSLFDIVFNNLAFVNNKKFIIPFYNNGSDEPNHCGEKELSSEPDGKLSNGLLINENADMCLAVIAGTEMIFSVIQGDLFQGQQVGTILDTGDIELSMELALDLGIGNKGVVRLPFYGTTQTVIVPKSLQTQSNEKGIDQAGSFPSGTELTGRVGDFNGDGWIDGTLVAVGNIPLDSPLFPGQPYAMHRNFETNIPIKGLLYGNVKKLLDKRHVTSK